MALNHHGLELNMEEMKQEGLVLHMNGWKWQFSAGGQELISHHRLRVVYFPVDEVLLRLHAKPVLSNVPLTRKLRDAGQVVRSLAMAMRGSWWPTIAALPGCATDNRSPRGYMRRRACEIAAAPQRRSSAKRYC